jgi:cytochrome-b5 reductase
MKTFASVVRCVRVWFGYLVFLITRRTSEYKLIERRDLTSGVTNPVILLRFEVPDSTKFENKIFDSVGVSQRVNGRMVNRYYSVASSAEDKGFFDLMIKVYPNSKMGTHLQQLKVGASVTVLNPIGYLDYLSINVNHIGIISGGVGLAPFVHLIRHVMKSQRNIHIKMLFANQTKQDIIMHDQLVTWAQEFPNFVVHFILSRPDDSWTGLKGRITSELIQEYMPSANLNPLIGICGPADLNKLAKRSLYDQGHRNYYVV